LGRTPARTHTPPWGDKPSSVADYYRRGASIFWLFSFLLGVSPRSCGVPFAYLHSTRMVTASVCRNPDGDCFRCGGTSGSDGPGLRGGRTRGRPCFALRVARFSADQHTAPIFVANLGGLYYIRRALPRNGDNDEYKNRACLDAKSTEGS